jgi:protein MpaA
MNLRPGVEKVLILGGTHGSEPTGTAIAHRLIIELKKNPQLYKNRYVAIVPEINPDGLAINSRVNAHGVDLNRNLPAGNWRLGRSDNSFGGHTPNSEPETQALVKLIERFKPDRILTLHSIALGRHGNNYDGPAESLAKILSKNNGYPILKTMGYSTPGSLGTWAGIERHIPIITLEVPRCRTPQQCWQENDRALIAFIRNNNENTRFAESDDRLEHQETTPPSRLGN